MADFNRAITLAMTGASGAQYGLRLLDCLVQANCQVQFLISDAARVVVETETELELPNDGSLEDFLPLNMLKLARLGVTVLPAMPGFYQNPETIDDLVDFVVARILDHLGVEQNLLPRWGS